MKSYMAKEADVRRGWYLVDGADKTVGRLAVAIASVLRGRTRPTYTPNVDTGDFVVVVNAEKVKFTGKKEIQKKYRWYTGFRGGLKEVNAERMREKHPDWILKQAVKGMLPKNRLSRGMLTRLKVYAGPEHPHGAQKPQSVDLPGSRKANHG